ncbi:MAG: amidohydrolase [Treponema sp.]|nr:amidohydrolase [Treponema sp.]
MAEKEVIQVLDTLLQQHRKLILDTGEYIWQNPETGYREVKSSAYLQERFIELGYAPVLMDGIPGFYADLETGRPGPILAVLGELDSVICASHPDADPHTGAVHACGHNAQCACLVGTAALLRDPRVLATLSGTIRFVAVPAEELLEVQYRMSLREKGIITYLGGKVEFLYRGVFDGVAAAVMIHLSGNKEKLLSINNRGQNGCLLKYLCYTGKAAHAGGGPYNGVNALYAATLGLNAINAIRETFREENLTRVHPILTAGGEAVNVIPDTIKLEAMVRGSSLEAMIGENKKITRALSGAALSMGASLRVQDIPGYMPLKVCKELIALSHQVGTELFGEEKLQFFDRWEPSSSDIGDLSNVMPAIELSFGGAEGSGHGNDYRIASPDWAYMESTRFIAALSCRLLASGGEELMNIKKNHTPVYGSYQAYFEAVDSLFSDRELLSYDGDSAKVSW